MIQVATAWDGVGVLVTADGSLLEDAVLVATDDWYRDAEHGPTFKQAREAAAARAEKRWLEQPLTLEDYAHGGRRPMPPLKWETYPR